MDGAPLRTEGEGAEIPADMDETFGVVPDQEIGREESGQFFPQTGEKREERPAAAVGDLERAEQLRNVIEALQKRPCRLQDPLTSWEKQRTDPFGMGGKCLRGSDIRFKKVVHHLFAQRVLQDFGAAEGRGPELQIAHRGEPLAQVAQLFPETQSEERLHAQAVRAERLRGGPEETKRNAILVRIEGRICDALPHPFAP